MKKTYAILVLAVIAAGCLKAETPSDTISVSTNAPKGGYFALRYETEWFDPGAGGNGVVWDWGHVRNIRESSLEYAAVGDSVAAVGRGTIDHYALSGDSLFLVGYQTPVISVSYDKPLLKMVYPLAFGRHFDGSFTSRGMYANSHAIEASGYVYAEADGYGSLLYGDEDSIPNVTRLHTVRTSYSSFSADSVLSGTVSSLLEVYECYEWFSTAQSHPLAETHSVSYYKDGVLFASARAAFASMTANVPSAKESQLWDGTDLSGSCEVEHPDAGSGCHACIRAGGVKGLVQIEYAAGGGQSLSVLVCDLSGVVYRRANPSNAYGTLELDCRSLRPGCYIVYVNAGGNVYSETIRL